MRGSSGRPRLVVVSHVLPYPGAAGQQQRVRYTLRGLRQRFHVTFLTAAPEPAVVESDLAEHCDAAIVMPTRSARSVLGKLPQRAAGLAHSARTGLRWSNYVIGKLEFSPDRLQPIADAGDFDCALFEYWHAWRSVSVFQARGIRCVLDMHDVLWRSRSEQLANDPLLPDWWKRQALDRYREREERAWSVFDAIVTINRGEHDYVSERAPGVHLFHTPMGTDLDLWRYQWNPAQPPRLAFYGGLSTPQNERAVLASYEQVMPAIWHAHPSAEFWIVGSRPSERVTALARDPRVHVTGFIEEVQPLLATMTAVLCPWSGIYGFRSRLVEVMALGVPVVANADAVHGMDLETDRGLFVGADTEAMSRLTIAVLDDPGFAQRHSRFAREQMERRFSLGATYDLLARDLRQWIDARGAVKTPLTVTA